MTIPERIERAWRLLAEWGADALLVGSPANRRWLSGFTGSAGWLLLTETEALLSTDFRYWEQVGRQAPAYTLATNDGRDRLPTHLIAQSGAKHVAFEAAHMTVDVFDRLQERAGPSVEWMRRSVTVEHLRAVKSPGELERIRRAAAITDLAVAQVPFLARPGVTEKALAWRLEQALHEGGADGAAFEIIVASGPNAALPHHRPGSRELAEGDALTIDIGALVDGYRSDLTRTFYLGETPDARFQEIYGLVLRAQTTALEQMRAGMTGQAIDALGRDIIEAAGYGEQFGHGLGHGVGLEIHERPSLGRLVAEEQVPAGSVVTVEPGVYLPGWGGVRIEDLVLLTADGAELLSHAPKEVVAIRM